MTYLLDTNVVSELTRRGADENLLDWLGSLSEDRTFVSVITIAELRKGVANLPIGRKRSTLEEWLRIGLIERFRERTIQVDVEIAEIWGEMAAKARSLGAAFGVMDGFLAATARARSLTIATRNERHFAQLGVALFNPWTKRG